MADVQLVVIDQQDAAIAIAVQGTENNEIALAAPEVQYTEITLAVPGVQGPAGEAGDLGTISDGTVTQPGLRFINDTNTGIYRPGTDQLAIVTNGASRLTFDASGNATFTGPVTIPAGSTVTDYLQSSAIGVTVQAYDADTAKYDATTANFTGTLQNGGSNVLVDTDIGSTIQAYDANLPAGNTILVDGDVGVTVQGYDADTAKYDAVTANFTGTLQNGGSNVVVDSDIGSTVQAYDANLPAGNTILVDGDVGVTVQGYDADTAKYDDITANFTGTLQNGGSNVLVDTDIGSTVQAYDTDTAKYDDITANFTGTLQNGGSNVLVGTDIGSTVQAYDADTAKYDDTTANFTGTLQNGGSNVLVDSDIGSTVQAYDADTAKYDDTTANFTGTLQNGGSNVLVDTDIGSTVQAYDANLPAGNTILVDSDIGSTVQAYDADTAKLDVVQTFTAVQTLTDPAIVGTILEDVYTITDGDAFEVNPGNGSVQLVTLGANRTPKATNFAAGEAVTLMINDGDAYTLTWTDTTWGTSGVVWTGGSAPTLATTGYTVVQFWKVGSQVYGAYVGDA